MSGEATVKQYMTGIVKQVSGFLTELLFIEKPYSGLSNKRAGWKQMCRLEFWAKFESFENLNPCWVDPTGVDRRPKLFFLLLLLRWQKVLGRRFGRRFEV